MTTLCIFDCASASFFWIQLSNKGLARSAKTTNEPKLGQNAIRFAITISLAFAWKDRLGSVFAVSGCSGKHHAQRAKRLALSQQVTTRLQGTDKTA